MVSDSRPMLNKSPGTLSQLFAETRAWRKAFAKHGPTALTSALNPYLALVDTLRHKLSWKDRWEIFVTGYVPETLELKPDK